MKSNYIRLLVVAVAIIGSCGYQHFQVAAQGLGQCATGTLTDLGAEWLCTEVNPQVRCATPLTGCALWCAGCTTWKKWQSNLPISKCVENEYATQGCRECQISQGMAYFDGDLICARGWKFANEMDCINGINGIDAYAWRSGICR